jgi:hypothetical protein
MTRALTIALLCAIILLPKFVYGQYGGYGAGSASKPGVSIDKQVSKPNSGGNSLTIFVDNLSSSDLRYHANDTVTFTIRIKNTLPDKALDSLIARDYFPSLLEPLAYPGNFDKAKRTLSIDAGRLESGQEKVFSYTAKVASESAWPAADTVPCIINKASVDTAGYSDEDTAQFCVERMLKPTISQPVASSSATKVPEAGASENILMLGIAAVSFILGIKLKRYKLID